MSKFTARSRSLSNQSQLLNRPSFDTRATGDKARLSTLRLRSKPDTYRIASIDVQLGYHEPYKIPEQIKFPSLGQNLLQP